MSQDTRRARPIEEIDRNFEVDNELGREDIRFFNVKETPQFLFGIQYDDTHFFRMPLALAEGISDAIQYLNGHPSGGRIRFRTNSPFVALSVKMPHNTFMRHMPASGTAGFDLYADGVSYRPFIPTSAYQKGADGYERLVVFPNEEAKEREIMIHFPLYNAVDEVYVGLQEGATLSEAAPYKIEAPAVFYGSSVTQGGCVSRPGLAYPAYLSRWFGVDYVNLGFSGNGLGEIVMAEHIASLNPSVFVMDYDYNAPTMEHLEATHYPFYECFRAHHPDTPIIMVSAPITPWHLRRMSFREIVRRSYEKAVAAGDRNVWFVDGQSLMAGDDWDACMVDANHPNDLGHYRMAKSLAPIMAEALERVKK